VNRGAARIRIAPKPLQIRAQFRRGLATHFAVFFKRLQDHALEVRRDVGVHAAGRRGHAVQDGVEEHG
jgi:hypothetical protein